MERYVALLSGGIESLVTAALMRDRMNRRGAVGHAVFVNYGQVPHEQEERAVRDIAREYGLHLEVAEVTLPFLGSHDMVSGDTVFYWKDVAEGYGLPFGRGAHERNHVVPYRNLMFISIAAAFAGQVKATQLWCGFDHHPMPDKAGWNTATSDKSPEFVKAFESTLTFGRDDWPRIKVVTPLQGNSKTKTIKRGEALGVKWSMSWSCYNAFTLPCGVCAQCRTRREAFSALGVDEGVDYCSIEFLRQQVSS